MTKIDMMETRWQELFTEYIDQDGVDISLFTGLDWQHYKLYGMLHNEFSKKYPKPESQREDETDTVDIPKAHMDPKAHLYIRALILIKEAYERAETLQHLAMEYEKKVVRLYCHLTRNWNQFGKDYLKILWTKDLYEIVESYFRILRKYGVSTSEEPYYFLSPEQKRKIKIEAEMLKRSTQYDDGEIKVSILEEYT